MQPGAMFRRAVVMGGGGDTTVHRTIGGLWTIQPGAMVTPAPTVDTQANICCVLNFTALYTIALYGISLLCVFS